MQIPQLHLVSEEAGDRGSCRVRGPNRQQYGVQPNPVYLQGIRDFPASKTISELRSFLGMVNHLSAYHPKIARHTGVLQALLKKNTSFLWLEDQQAAFDRLKSDLLSALSLNHFDPSWSKRLVTDASRLHGLGFVLMQHQDDKKKVIQCGSRSLLPAEKNYSTLELELTAIVWAIQKCNFFLKGIEKFEVVKNHRPLIGIFAKPMPQIDNTRITRLREKILDRPFEVKWMAGKENVIVDALSRAPATSTEGSTAVPMSSCVIAPNYGARQHHRMLPSRSCIQTSGRRFQSRSTSVGSPHRPPSTPSEASLGSDFAIRRRHPACGWGQAISASRGTSRHSAPIARGTLRIRENPTNCKGPILLAFDETRHQDHDRQMRGLPAAEAEQTRQTSHHDIGQLPYGANLHRSVSR